MKLLILLTAGLFISAAHADSPSVEDLCLDYLKISQASESYKGNEAYLNSCLEIKKDMDKKNELKNKLTEYLKSNSTIKMDFRIESKNFDSLIVNQSTIECSSYNETAYCTASVDRSFNVCDLNFTRIQFEFNEDASSVSQITAYQAPSCISW